MRKLFTLISLLGFSYCSVAQQLPEMPLPDGAGNAEVWDGSIYHFGGSSDWSGTIIYPRIYKFNGSGWDYYDSIPDNNLWDVETTRVGNFVYLLGGWPAGSSLNRRYNLSTGEWVYLSPSPNVSQTWGITAQELDGVIYTFNSKGDVFAYHTDTDTWTTKTSKGTTGAWDMNSILFHDEIYIIGWGNKAFYKYSPSTDHWVKLADLPFQVGACGFGIINDLIYCIGGNAGGGSAASFKSILVYNITDNSWKTDTQEISSKRHWMATAEYLGGLYIIGGIDSNAQSVNTVEEIVPQGVSGSNSETAAPKEYKLEQNYPNPFITSTKISFTLPITNFTTLKVYDIFGTEVATLVNEVKFPGTYEVNINLHGYSAGLYYYTLQSGKFKETKKLVLQK